MLQFLPMEKVYVHDLNYLIFNAVMNLRQFNTTEVFKIKTVRGTRHVYLFRMGQRSFENNILA
jgi:hypothetical protein